MWTLIWHPTKDIWQLKKEQNRPFLQPLYPQTQTLRGNIFGLIVRSLIGLMALRHPARLQNTDKGTDESWDMFITYKINSGLVWAAGPYLWKKKFRAIYEQLLRPIFLYFHGQKLNFFSWKYCSIRTEKLQRIKVKKVKNILGSIFLRGKPSFFRAKNINVSTKTLWSVLCWLLLCFKLIFVFQKYFYHFKEMQK